MTYFSSCAAIECKNVRDLELVRVRASKPGPNEPAIGLEEVREAVVQSCSAAAGASALVRLKGEGNHEITLALNRVSKQTKEVVFTDGASEDSVVRRS